MIPQAVALHSREIDILGIANQSSVHARPSQMVHGVGNITAAILDETSVDTEQGVLTTEAAWAMPESFFDVIFLFQCLTHRSFQLLPRIQCKPAILIQSQLDATDKRRDGSRRRFEAVCEGVECLGGEPGESVRILIGQSGHDASQYTCDGTMSVMKISSAHAF